MTTTNLGLNGQPAKFLGAYVKNISTSLGLSTNPSSCTITVVEDPLTNAFFEEPIVGSYHTIEVGPTWKFSGIIKRYEKDIRNIGGRQINITMYDVRDIMRSIPVILSPGYEAVTMKVRNTQCSCIDIFSAFYVEGGVINLSGWTQAGMQFKRIINALHGDNILFGSTHVPIGQQIANAFGERYRFNFTALLDRVDPEYRINTNLVPISNIVEDLSSRHSFDWFVNSERASDGVIDVSISLIDRSRDQTTINLPTFLNSHNGKVVSCTSGIELRNDVSCLALLGAPVEQLTRVAVKGLANEPLDLSSESGNHKYLMTETEMRVVLGGKLGWEIWLGIPQEYGGGGGFSRYGGTLLDTDINPLFVLNALFAQNVLDGNGNIPKNKERKANYLLGVQDARYSNAGQLFEKLHAHAEATYGKRWVHDDIFDEIIDSAWTRGAIVGNDDPYEYFQQKDGRTRAFVEFNSEGAGGAFSLGLSNLTSLFGSQDVFRNVTKFGTTFSTILPGEPGQNGSILVVELKDEFAPSGATFNTDRANYVYNDSENPYTESFRTKLYMACTVDKDGVLTLPCPVVEKIPTPEELMQMAIDAYNQENNNAGSDAKTDADGNALTVNDYLESLLRRYYGTSLFEIASKCYQPAQAYIPTRSRYRRYGPVFSSELDGESQGKLEILQDDGFAPWEFGGLALMSGAMQLKVDNATSLQREVFSANITIEGYPEMNLGDSLEKNANITSLSISFGGGGLTTSYGLQTFTRKFGEFSKEDWARFALLTNGAGPRVFPQNQIGFVENTRVNVTKQFVSQSSNRALFGGGNRVG